MALRAQNDYEVMKQLPEIGWRASKQYFNVSLRPINAQRTLNRTKLYAVRLYEVCMRPFRHSQQQRSVCTAAVQPAPDGLYQVECAVRAYCHSLLLCLRIA